MPKKLQESHTLAEPKHALRVYLNALLSEVTLVTEAESAPPNQNVTDLGLGAALERATEIVDVGSDVELPAQAEVQNNQSSILIPDWAQVPFQGLSFKVAGVTLVAPLEKLNGIVELQEEITGLPGYASWVIGLLPNRGKNVQVVDVAKIIMPDESASVAQPAAERMKFIIFLEDGKFGLAVDSISEVLSLESGDVRWRNEYSHRPWLAGTIINQMCALLDVDLLCAQLQAGL